MAETLGRFLSNVIEFIIAGVLFMSTVALSFRLLFPSDFAGAWSEVTSSSVFANSEATTFMVVGAFAYVAGTLAENISRVAFEWRLDQVKARRKRRHPEITDHGDMRFSIMAQNPDLYIEVDSQVKRMRIERVVALCESILLATVLLTTIATFSWFRLTMGAILASALLLTLMQVDERFNRYCRAIERGYIESTRNL